MNKKIYEIWGRGGLGNQILEYLLGIGWAISEGQDISLNFSSHSPSASDNVYHKQEDISFRELFKCNHDINISRKEIKKLCYWDEKFIAPFFENRNKIFAEHFIPKFSLNQNNTDEYSAIHVRGTDKCLDEAFRLYDRLFYAAKLKGLDIKIVTDDMNLSSQLADRHSISRDKIEKNSLSEDWLTLARSNHIFSIYSTFSYSILLIDPNKKYTISSYPDSKSSYKYVGNEYRVICELQKYCKHLSILGGANISQSQAKRVETIEDSQIKAIEESLRVCKFIDDEMRSILAKNLVIKDIKRLPELIEKIISYADSPSLPEWHLNKAKKVERREEIKELIFGGAKSLDGVNFPIHMVEKGLIHARDLIARRICDETKAQTRKQLQNISNKFINPKNIRELDEEGVLVIPNFLESEKHECLTNELSEYQKLQMGTLSRKKKSLIYTWNKESLAYSLVFSKHFRDMLAYMSGYDKTTTSKMIINNTFFQDVDVDPDSNDIQTVLHCDTYFSAFKFWYFPDDVNEDQSPFSYCRKSHKLSKSRMIFNYQSTLDVLCDRNKAISKDHREGSFRVTDREIHDLESKREKICVNGNSLVIANVMGFHARSVGQLRIRRRAIHGSLRHINPFYSIQ